MFKKITAALAAAVCLATPVLAITPDTVGMYEKIDQIELVELTGSNLTAVYVVVGILCLVMIGFYLWDRRKRRQTGEGRKIK